jgi:hypothetical protein
MRMHHALFVAALAAGCVAEGSNLGESVEAVTTGWSDDTQIYDQQSARETALAYDRHWLHLVHAGSSNPSELWWSKYDGTKWSANDKLTAYADGSPALAFFYPAMHLAYKVAGQAKIVVTTDWGRTPVTVGESGSYYDPQTGSWTETPKTGISMTVLASRLYLAYCNHVQSDLESYDYVQIVSKGSSGVWSRYNDRHHYKLPAGSQCTGVALWNWATGSLLHLVANAHYSGYTKLLQTDSSANANVWQSISMNSARPVSVAVCGNDAWLVHSGDAHPDEIWFSTWTSDLSGWPANVKLTDQTSNGGPAVGCYGAQAIMVHNGGSNQLWWARSFVY